MPISLAGLVKSESMQAVKFESTPLREYNRWRVAGICTLGVVCPTHNSPPLLSLSESQLDLEGRKPSASLRTRAGTNFARSPPARQTLPGAWYSFG